MSHRFSPPPRGLESIELQRWLDSLYYEIPRSFDSTLDPASVAANTTAEQTFTVSGLQTSDFVVVSKPTHEAGLGIVNARVSASNTLAITFSNSTGSAIDPASATYSIISFRK